MSSVSTLSLMVWEATAEARLPADLRSREFKNTAGRIGGGRDASCWIRGSISAVRRSIDKRHKTRSLREWGQRLRRCCFNKMSYTSARSEIVESICLELMGSGKSPKIILY